MPRVPTSDGFQVMPNVRQGRAVNPVDPNAASLPGRQFEQFGNQLQQAGGVAGQVAQQEQAKINKVRLNDVYNESLNEIARIKREYGELQGKAAVGGINGRSLTDHYSEALRKSFSKIGGDLRSPELERDFAVLAQDLEGRFVREAQDYELAQGRVYEEQVRDATVLSAFERIATDPTNGDQVRIDLARARSALTDKLRDAGYSGDALNQQIAMAMGKSHNVVISRLLTGDDLDGAKAYFEAHRDDYLELDAQAVPDMFRQKEAELRRKRYEGFSLGITQDRIRPADLEAAYESGDLDDGEYNALLTQSMAAQARKESERRARVTEWRDQNYAILQVGISDGRLGRADADLALDKGMITYSQWSQAARMGTERSAAQTSMDAFLDNITLGVPIDPSDTDMKRGAAEYFRQTGAADLLKSGDAEAFSRGMAAVQTMAVDAGIIPEPAVTTLRGLKASGNERQQMFAIRAIGELYNQQPNATDAAFSAGEVAEAISFQFKMNAGVEPQTAYAAILVEREARNEPPGSTSVSRARVGEARRLASDLETKDALRTPDRGGFMGMFRSSNISGGALAEQQILTDYQQAFQTHYVTHGDEELAAKQADALITRTVGKSRINNGRVMMHPPERFYPGVGHNWMQETLREAVRETMGDTEARIGTGDIELISDVQTSRDVRDGRRPSYAVKVRTGEAEQVMPMRWSFDAEAVEERARQAQNARRRARQGAARIQRTINAFDHEYAPMDMMTADQAERIMKATRGPDVPEVD